MDAAIVIEIDDDDDDDNSFGVCPVCDILVKRETLEHHVETHFDGDGNGIMTMYIDNRLMI